MAMGDSWIEARAAAASAAGRAGTNGGGQGVTFHGGAAALLSRART